MCNKKTGIIRRNISINLISHFRRWKSEIIPLFHPPFYRRSRLCLRDARTSQDVPRAQEGGYGEGGWAERRKKVGDDESENERWMLARDRSGHVRQHPFPCFFPRHPVLCHPPTRLTHHPRAVVSFLPSSSLFFLPTTAVFSHVTRLFGSFFLITCSVGSNRKWLFLGLLNRPSTSNSVHTGIFELENVECNIFKCE